MAKPLSHKLGPEGQISKEVHQAEPAPMLDFPASEENRTATNLIEFAATTKTSIISCVLPYRCPEHGIAPKEIQKRNCPWTASECKL